MDKRTIMVTTRQEFVKLYREIFIKDNPYEWNHGYNLNTWTHFYVYNKNLTLCTSVELKETKK